jgi:hypothetical protein
MLSFLKETTRLSPENMFNEGNSNISLGFSATKHHIINTGSLETNYSEGNYEEG